MITRLFAIITVYITLCLAHNVIKGGYLYSDDDNTNGPAVYSGADYESPFKSCLPGKEETDEQPLPEEEAWSAPSFTVQGVVWGGAFPQAIIDENVVKVGDKIKEAEVLEINKDKIKLFYKGKAFFLNINDGKITMN